MNLRIDGGFLLKPYTAPYTRQNGGGHKIRQGWTPDRTPAMQSRFDEMRAESDDVPDRLLWLKVESDEGERLVKRRRPYPGWFPIGPRSDKAISKAYRALFVTMNPGYDEQVLLAGKRSGPKAVVPPDGDYIFERGVMRPVTDEHGVSAQDVTQAIDEIAGKMLRGGTNEGEQ